MIVLDTDHMNILQIGKCAAFETLLARMNGSPDQHFCVTVVTVEEHMRGWLASLRRAHSVAQHVWPYDQLINLVRFFQAWEILRFGDVAVQQFHALRGNGVRIGSLDLTQVTLLARSDKDLGPVSGVSLHYICVVRLSKRRRRRGSLRPRRCSRTV